MKKFILILIIVFSVCFIKNVEAALELEKCDKNTMSINEFCTCTNNNIQSMHKDSSGYFSSTDFSSMCVSVGCYWKANSNSTNTKQDGICYSSEENAFQEEKQNSTTSESSNLSIADEQKACSAITISIQSGYSTPSTCTGTTGCIYIADNDSGYCVSKRWYYSHETKPDLDEIGVSITGENCETIDAKIRNKQYTKDFCTGGCEWNSRLDKCVDKLIDSKCSEITSVKDCNNSRACKWYTEKNKCMIDLDIYPNPEKVVKSCADIFATFWDDLKYIGKIFRIVAPILVLVLSTYDYVVAIASKDADGLKKANTRMIKRLVLIVVLIFLPTLVEIFLALLVGADVPTCIS